MKLQSTLAVSVWHSHDQETTRPNTFICVKGKVHRTIKLGRHSGGVEVQLYSFFNLGAKWRGGGQSHAIYMYIGKKIRGTPVDTETEFSTYHCPEDVTTTQSTFQSIRIMSVYKQQRILDVGILILICFVVYSYQFCRLFLLVLSILICFAVYSYQFCRLLLLVLPFIFISFVVYSYLFCRLFLLVLSFILICFADYSYQFCRLFLFVFSFILFVFVYFLFCRLLLFVLSFILICFAVYF